MCEATFGNFTEKRICEVHEYKLTCIGYQTQYVMCYLVMPELNMPEENADVTSAKFVDHSFSTSEDPINKYLEDAAQNNKGYGNSNNFESLELEAHNDSDKADDSIDEELVDECQKHDEECKLIPIHFQIKNMTRLFIFLAYEHYKIIKFDVNFEI